MKVIRRGAVEILVDNELEKGKLRQAAQHGKPAPHQGRF